jgi:hypothetical protein
LLGMSLSKSERCSRALMLALGLSCVISGLYYVSQSYTDTRAMLIGQYSSAIQSFTSDYLPFFSALDIDIFCDGQNSERLLRRKEEVKGVCRGSKCDLHSDIPSYINVVYVFQNISRNMIGCQLAISPSKIPTPPVKSLLPLPPAPLTKPLNVHLNAKMCGNRGGTFHDGACFVQGWLKSGCLTVSGTSVSNVSVGGVVSSGSSCDLVNAVKTTDVWDFAEYHTPSASPLLFVRSFKDPYMIAQVITEGTLDFGSTPKDNYSTGVVLLSLGCTLFLPQICLCAFRFRGWLQERHRRRYHADLDRAAEVASDSPVGVSSSSVRKVGRKRHEMFPVSDGGTIVDLSSTTRRPSPRSRATIADVSVPASNV